VLRYRHENTGKHSLFFRRETRRNSGVPRRRKMNIKPLKLPNAWELDEEWFGRLEIPEDLRRHYSHLSICERQAWEQLRLLVEHYKKSNVLQDGKTARSLLRRIAEELDIFWLLKGKGRAVDFKNTFEVFERYSKYQAWTEDFPQGDKKIIDKVFPYGKFKEKEYDIRGFFRIEIWLSHPILKRDGKIKWELGKIKITDLKVDESLMTVPQADFYEANPSKYRPVKLMKRDYQSSDSVLYPTELDKLKGGFVGSVVGYCLDSVTEWHHTQYKNIFREAWLGGFFVNDIIEKFVKDPTVSQFQEFLAGIAKFYFDWRVPKKDWKLQFNVAPDLSSITVATATV
jgi:hypothetical protein